METKGKVDVLAAIDDEIAIAIERGSSPQSIRIQRFTSMRAAVAELIEAADRVAWTYGDAYPQCTGPEFIRLKTALSALRSSQGGREGDEGEGRG